MIGKRPQNKKKRRRRWWWSGREKRKKKKTLDASCRLTSWWWSSSFLPYRVRVRKRRETGTKSRLKNRFVLTVCSSSSSSGGKQSRLAFSFIYHKRKKESKRLVIFIIFASRLIASIHRLDDVQQIVNVSLIFPNKQTRPVSLPSSFGSSENDRTFFRKINGQIRSLHLCTTEFSFLGRKPVQQQTTTTTHTGRQANIRMEEKRKLMLLLRLSVKTPGANNNKSIGK